jgi:hypothetical protein
MLGKPGLIVKDLLLVVTLLRGQALFELLVLLIRRFLEFIDLLLHEF